LCQYKRIFYVVPKEKSKQNRVKSGLLVGHRIEPLQPVNLPRNTALKTSITCSRAPSCLWLLLKQSGGTQRNKIQCDDFSVSADTTSRNPTQCLTWRSGDSVGLLTAGADVTNGVTKKSGTTVIAWQRKLKITGFVDFALRPIF
jgi:hypothetical protein